MAHKVPWNCTLGPAIALDLQKRGKVETASIFDLQKRGPCRDDLYIWPSVVLQSPWEGNPAQETLTVWRVLTYAAQAGLELLHSNNPLPWASQALCVEVLAIYLAPRTLLKRCFDIVKEKSFSGTKAIARKAVRDSEGSGKSAREELLMRSKEETYIKLSLSDNWACGRARGLVSRECWFMLLVAWRPLPSVPPQWATVRLSDPPWWHSWRVFYKHRLCVCFTPWCWKWLTICKATSVHSASFPSKGNWGSSLRHSPRVSRKLDCPY